MLAQATAAGSSEVDKPASADVKPAPADDKTTSEVPAVPESQTAVTQTEPVSEPVTPSSGPAESATAEPDADGYIYYIVDYDDNIWNIAKEQLGDVNLWDEILEENKDIIKDQDHIYVGQRLRLPKKAS